MATLSRSKPLVWLSERPKTPPLSITARGEIGTLLRQLQEGDRIEMPSSRPMPTIDVKCHELRLKDGESRRAWRLIYAIETEAIVVLSFFEKKTQKTPKKIIEVSRQRLQRYRDA